MKITTFDFGFFEHVHERILIIVINEGVVIDGALSRKLISLIDEVLEEPSVLIIDRRNDYSYSGTGMVTLKDSKLSNVVATAIVAYSVLSEHFVDTQVNVMNTVGRSHLNVFSSLEQAMGWANQLLEAVADTVN